MPRPSRALIVLRAIARGRVLWCAAVAALALTAPGWLPRAGDIKGPALWGVMLLVSFAGWGAWLARRLMRGVDLDLALRAAWGMALTLAVGGLLALVGLARRPVLIVWTAGGLVLAASAAVQRVGDRARRARELTREAGWYTLLAAALGGVTLFLALGGVAHSFPNPSDDWPAYLPLVHKLLQTGTLIEPFSVRRMAAYGGQTLLQAFALIVARDTQIQLFDGGICLVLAVGLIFGAARATRGSSWTVLLLAACVPLMLPDNRANSASEVSGVVGFLALWRTIAVVDQSGRRDRGAAWLIGLCAAAVATLRQNYLPAVACVLLALLSPVEGDDGQVVSPAERRRFFGAVALAGAACLAPWALLALRSGHTFLFPFVHGNYDPMRGGIAVPTPWYERLKFCFGHALHGEPVNVMPLVLIGLPAAAVGAGRRAALGLWVGTMLAFALLAWSLPGSDSYTIARYDLGYAVALVMAAGLAAAGPSAAGPAGDGGRRLPGLALVVVALALQIHDHHGPLLKTLNGTLDRLRSVDGSPPAVTALGEVERRMQAAVPAGARLLVMIERPYMLDFTRNRVDILDQPGAASPAPGIPLAEGPDATASYLQAQGIRYFAFARPDRAQTPLYSRSHWRDMASSSSELWRVTAHVYLDTFQVVDRLAQTRRVLYDDGRLVVVDLDQRISG
jgi:hypothetical protein